MENKTVWVVSKGEYSDRYIVGIASTRERAETMAAMHTDTWEGCDLEEYELDTDHDYITSLYMKVWDVARFSNGEIIAHYGNPSDIIPRQYPEIINTVMEGKDHLRVLVVAEQREQAVKKASDIFAKYRAEKLGL